jgi:hypothetical protein
MSAPKKDDLEAVRIIIDLLADFSKEEQERIFRWTAEKLALAPVAASASGAMRHSATEPQTAVTAGASTDIKSFMSQKKPRNDVQFAAAAAYYYRFEAPPAERKEAINKEDLQEAARKANHERFSNPSQTLANAHNLGLLDRGSEKATFVINSVGENLVAMTLPDGALATKPRSEKRAKKSIAKVKRVGKKTSARAKTVMTKRA